jgi:hypothetical protein
MVNQKLQKDGMIQSNSALARLFERYLKKSDDFNRNILVKVFSSRGKRRVSNEKLVIAGINQELQLWSDLQTKKR